jgi:hypothetical protein
VSLGVADGEGRLIGQGSEKVGVVAEVRVPRTLRSHDEEPDEAVLGEKGHEHLRMQCCDLLDQCGGRVRLELVSEQSPPLGGEGDDVRG